MVDQYSMCSRRPYLIKPCYEWIVDSGCTPYILVEVLDDSVKVPQDYVHNDQIVLNIAPHSVQDLSFEDQLLTFNATFGGEPMSVEVPFYAVRGVFAKENQEEGMFFDDVDDQAEIIENSSNEGSDGFTLLK